MASWKKYRLGELITLTNGSAIRKRDIQSQGAIPVFGANGRLGFTSKFNVENRTISIGRVGSCGAINSIEGPAWMSDNVMFVKSKSEKIDWDFLFYVFLVQDFTEDIRKGAMPSLSQKPILCKQVAVPPLDEQRRIVARIKECMERVEEIEGLRAEAIEESDALVQSVLHDTWRSDEIASAEKMALDELGQITTGNTPSRKKPEFFGGSQPWVTPGDFNGRLIATGRECLSKKGIAEGRARVVPEGSVLVVCIGATIGKVALAVRDLGINQQINAVTFDKEKVLPEYGYWACRALVPEIIGNASKNTLPILNKGKFSKLQIPVPSLYIQGQVSSKLDAVEVAVSEMRRDLSESNIASTALRESILRKAFAEEL